MTAHVLLEGEKATVRFSYDPGVVAELKASVPSFARSWDPERKVWTVHQPYVDQVVTMLRRLAAPVTVTEARQQPNQDAPPPPRTDARGRELNPWAALRSALPEQYRSPVFLAIVKVLHPDKTGNDPACAKVVRQLTAEFRA